MIDEIYWCKGCGDELVDDEGLVCDTCLASSPEDWVKGEYENMRKAARKSGQLKESR